MGIAVILFISASGHSYGQSKRLRKYVIVPAWKIQLVDEAGNPLKTAVARQIWQDYDVEDHSHEQDLRPDKNGYVNFPERSIRTSPKTKAIGRAKNLKRLGVHASIGPHAYILAWSDKLEGDITYAEGEPLPTKLVMRPKRK